MSKKRKSKKKKKPARPHVLRRTPDERVIEVPAELLDAFEETRLAFVEKFGREPRPEDPVFFDPEADEPREMTSAQVAEIEREASKAMREAGLSEAYIYAWKKTGMLLTQDNEDLFTEEELDEFDAAMDEVRGPRVWAFEPDAEVDAETLDTDDPDDRRAVIFADHPELADVIRAGLHEIELDGAPMSPRLHLAMHEVVLNQILDGDPPETSKTATRLRGLGYDRHEVLHMLASVVATELWDVLDTRKPSERTRLVAALDALPRSWERQRPPPSGS